MLSAGARLPPYCPQKPNTFTAILPRKQIPFVLLQTKVSCVTFDWWTWSHVTCHSCNESWESGTGLIIRCFPHCEGRIFTFTRCKLVRKRTNAHLDSKADPGLGSNSSQYLWSCFAFCLLLCYQEVLLALRLNSNVFTSSNTDHTNM